MAIIEIKHLGGDAFRVTVSEPGSGSTHDVMVDSRPSGLPDSITDQDLIQASFRFLLDREPKESIMRRFDLSVISRFFHEYESKIAEYL